MDIEGLLQLSGRASDVFMMTCFCLPQQRQFQDDGRQEILVPQLQFQASISYPDVPSMVCPYIKANTIFRGFTPIGNSNVRQVVLI